MLEPARPPAVAGRFYPGEAHRLAAEIRRCLPVAPTEPVAARLLMVPHAGYVYSGAIAGETYACAKVPASALVLCPNHTGLGDRRSLWGGGDWRFPGFTLGVDRDLTRRLAATGLLHADERAHVIEHAAEVQMPFLHARRSDVKVVPICLGRLGLEECQELGAALARVIRESEHEREPSVLLVASSDMSHYERADLARQHDSLALARVLALDPAGLLEVCERERISMCGCVPTVVGLFAARELAASRAELVRYGNSGEVSGDFDQVVGYAGVIVS